MPPEYFYQQTVDITNGMWLDNDMSNTEYVKGYLAGWEDALLGFSLNAAYSGSFGEGYLAGWTAATS